MDKSIFGRNDLSIENDYAPKKNYLADEIVPDLNFIEDSARLMAAIPISAILNRNIDDLHRDLGNTKSSDAAVINASYKAVRGLIDRGEISKTVSWYRDLEKKMAALDILILGANFDAKFEEKAEEGADNEMNEINAFHDWLEMTKDIQDEDFFNLSGEEMIALRDEFDTLNQNGSVN